MSKGEQEGASPKKVPNRLRDIASVSLTNIGQTHHLLNNSGNDTMQVISYYYTRKMWKNNSKYFLPR